MNAVMTFMDTALHLKVYCNLQKWLQYFYFIAAWYCICMATVSWNSTLETDKLLLRNVN